MGPLSTERNWVWQFHLFARPLACPSAINNSSNYWYCGASHSQFRRQTWLFYYNNARNICIFSLPALVPLIFNAMLTQWVRQTQMKEQKKILSWPLYHGLAKHWLNNWTKVSSWNKWLCILYCLTQVKIYFFKYTSPLGKRQTGFQVLRKQVQISGISAAHNDLGNNDVSSAAGVEPVCCVSIADVDYVGQ